MGEIKHIETFNQFQPIASQNDSLELVMGSNEAAKQCSERVSNCLLYLVFKSLKFTFIKSAETLYINIIY